MAMWLERHLHRLGWVAEAFGVIWKSLQCGLWMSFPLLEKAVQFAAEVKRATEVLRHRRWTTTRFSVFVFNIQSSSQIESNLR